MASHKHCKLPPYRLTGRFGAAVNVRSIHRGRRIMKQSVPESQHDQEHHSPDDIFHMDDTLQPSIEDEDTSLTLHELQSELQWQAGTS